MKNLVGKKWGELIPEQQELLLKESFVYDAYEQLYMTNYNQSTVIRPNPDDPEIILDFANGLSVPAVKFNNDEIKIDDEAVLYDPTK